ncbi:MAG: hypothetical protein KKD18_05290 [Nanoarchaeota archaeon]|nr:hypothetical protein [Nanoarchaeota archaeon]MBU0977804.1 hypothetical protein [Nanoarchaeota archaeon]
MVVKEILQRELKSSALIRVILQNTKSKIIQDNNKTIYCSVYYNFKGLFRKDSEETKKFGKKICDAVKSKLKNHGFFTSDELPNYGVSERDLELIKQELQPDDNDLIILFAYQKEEAQKTKDLLNRLLIDNAPNVI